MKNDNDLDNLLRDWADDRLPDNEKRTQILNSVKIDRVIAQIRPRRERAMRRMTAVLWVGVTITTLLMTMLLQYCHKMIKQPNPVVDVAVIPKEEAPIRVSLIVLKKIPDSETAVEFLEDSIFVAEGKTLHELKLGEHRLFLWIYPLEEALFSLDIGIDQAGETGIVAIPDRPKALQFISNGDQFDVFVSVLPQT
jgi:hypothetical protein